MDETNTNVGSANAGGVGKPKMPVGMIIILVLIGWGALSSLLSLRKPVSQLGPMLLTGAGAMVMSLITTAILIAIFVGIIKRFAWARKLAIGWYIFSMLLILVNLLSFMANKTMYDSYYNTVLAPDALALMSSSVIMMGMIMALFFGWVIGIIIVIYIWKKKDFFTN